MNRQFLRVFFILSVSIWGSCLDSSQKPLEERLAGEWKLIEAKRNNRKTSTLTNGFFMFDASGYMMTNIFGDTTSYPYTIHDMQIIQESPSMIIYNIHKLNDDTLHLKSKIKNYFFDFTTLRLVDSTEMR